MENSKISIRDVSKSFGTKKVLQKLSLEVPEGKSFVILGPSGVGKSILLKTMLGIVTPEQGVIEIDGVNILSSRKTRIDKTNQIGMLFQGAALFDSFKVWENIAFRLIQGEGQSRKQARIRADECLAQVGLTPDVANAYPSEISGGMQKRVGLARAIAAKPKILFFDEPTTGLDPIMADIINTLIKEQVSALGATAISITHDMASAKKIGDRLAMLHQGQIIWQGSADEIDHSGNGIVDQFINGRAEGPLVLTS